MKKFFQIIFYSPENVSNHIFHKSSAALKPNIKEDVAGLTQLNNIFPHLIEKLFICFLAGVGQWVSQFFQNNFFSVLNPHNCIGMFLLELDGSKNGFAFLINWKLKFWKNRPGVVVNFI